MAKKYVHLLIAVVKETLINMSYGVWMGVERKGILRNLAVLVCQ